MKKILYLFIIFIGTIILASCNNTNNGNIDENPKENVEYEMYIDETFLEDLETGSKKLYFYSHMPRKDDVEEVYIGRRTAFPRY